MDENQTKYSIKSDKKVYFCCLSFQSFCRHPVFQPNICFFLRNTDPSVNKQSHKVLAEAQQAGVVVFFQFQYMANWWEITDVTIRPIGILLSLRYRRGSTTSLLDTEKHQRDHLAKVVQLENHPLLLLKNEMKVTWLKRTQWSVLSMFVL